LATTKLKVNGKEYDAPVDATDDSIKLLWVLRNDLQLTGTKFGCGMAECGACTVHLDGEAIRSCITPVSAAVGKEITTIEGLAQGDQLHPLQQAWIDERTPQCGYCQSGQIMEAAAFLAKNPHPSDDEIVEAMNGHICRCGTYNRIFNAVKSAASKS
jgi:aerobic-type carbon monoxide dehydrogenase small subunit (CoxS/CutS family)